jgi:hypothetical protein
MALCLLSAPVVAAESPAPAAKSAASDTLACMRTNIPTQLRRQDVELKLYENDALVRSMSGRLYAQRDPAGKGAGPLRASLRITEPAALAGSSYLVSQSDNYLQSGMYVYLPSVRRVRRVTGTIADGAIMGTQFSYYEFQQLHSAFGGLKPKDEAVESLDGREAIRISFSGEPDAGSVYTGVVAWIDRQSCLPLQVEFKQGDEVLKRMSAPAASLTAISGTWYAKELRMLDLRTQAYTVIVTNDVHVGGRSDGVFDPERFYSVQ